MKRLYKHYFHCSIIILFLITSCVNTTKTAIESNDKIVLPEQSECLLLIEAGILPENSSLFVDRFGKASLLIDSLIYPLEKENADSLPTFLIHFYHSTVPKNICFFDDGDIWFTEGEYLCRLQEDKKDTIINLPFKDIHISGAEDGIYLSSFNEEDNVCNLFFVNKNKNEIHKLLSNTSPLRAIGTGDATIVAADSTVYLLEDNTTFSLFKATERILHLAFAPDGIFYATESNVGYFDPKINIIFLEKPVRDMLSFGNKLYLLLKDGSLYKITNTEYFNELSNIIN